MGLFKQILPWKAHPTCPASVLALLFFVPRHARKAAGAERVGRDAALGGSSLSLQGKPPFPASTESKTSPPLKAPPWNIRSALTAWTNGGFFGAQLCLLQHLPPLPNGAQRCHCTRIRFGERACGGICASLAIMLQRA